MKSLLKRRFLPLGIFLLLALGLWLGAVPYFAQALANATRVQAQLKADRASAEQVFADRRTKKEYMEGNKTVYAQLQEMGFLSPQDRLDTARRVQELARQYRLSDFEFSFQPEKPVEGMTQTPDKLVRTTVTVKVSAVTDLDLLSFAQDLPSAFTGIVNTRSMTMSKLPGGTTKPGEAPAFVKASIDIDWYAFTPTDRS